MRAGRRYNGIIVPYLFQDVHAFNKLSENLHVLGIFLYANENELCNTSRTKVQQKTTNHNKGVKKCV